MLRLLNALYKIAGGIAAAAIVAITMLVSAQVCLNILARIGGPDWSYTIPSYADFAGFLLAAATFFALAHTLRAGGHIRVNLAVQAAPPAVRWALELAALTLGVAVAGTATWFCIDLVAESLRYGDMSTGIVAVPLWIPQLPMVIGLALLTVALLHTLAEAIIARAPILKDQGSE
ncbi:MAG: TRAP-type C4-dicarboxylate transport system permease small subunit [Paracoccaceae bacterium]|jgi:TRAP-type C4-dicarboxylate transport system permease small subunit